MKKITLFFASALFLGVTSLYAQSQDSTSTQDKNSQTQSSSSTDDNQSQNYTKNMTKIQSSDIPAALRSTLQGSQYKGWEKGTIFRAKDNEGYAIEFKEGNKTKSFRFDANGKPQDPH